MRWDHWLRATVYGVIGVATMWYVASRSRPLKAWEKLLVLYVSMILTVAIAHEFRY